jgi:hypothetical protein
MTKGKFTETVLLKIEGFQLNDSSSVQRRDIRAYLPAAVNYAMMAGYNINIQVEGNRDFSSVFYGYFPALAISKDTTRHNWKYITLPKGTIALPKNQGIRSIEDGSGYNLKPLSDNAFRTINSWLETYKGDGYYRLEGNKIYLFNISAIATVINLSMIVDTDSLTDDDILPIPAGLEGRAIDICYEFLTGVRQLPPADRKSDERDIN